MSRGLDREPIPPPSATYQNAVCKGDWLLGTACGTCERCVEMAKPTIDALRATKAAQERVFKAVTAVITPNAPGYEPSDRLKVACFDEVRGILYGAAVKEAPRG